MGSLLLGETEVHLSCGENSFGDWHSGKEHAAHLGHQQYHTGHRFGNYFNSMSLSQNVGCEHEVWNELHCEWHYEQVEKHVFGKDVRQMSDQSPFCRKSTPSLVISMLLCSFECVQNKVPSTPSVCSWRLRQNSWDQWVHSFADSVWSLKIPYTIVSDRPWQKEYGVTSNRWTMYLAAY